MINQHLLTSSLKDKIAEDYLVEKISPHVRTYFTEEMSKSIKKALEIEEKKQKHDEFFDALFKSTAPHEKKLSKAIDRIWHEEEAVIVANLKKLKKGWFLPHFAKGDDDKVSSVIYPPKEYEKKITAATTPIAKTVIDERGNKEMAQLGIGIDFDVENEEVKKWLETYIPRFSERLEEVNIEKLREELLEGLKEGEGVRELTTRVNETYANWYKVRSERIARTEILRVSNRGALEAYRQSGVVKKKVWITNFGPRTCPFCEQMDGTVVELEKVFAEGNKFNINVDGKEQSLDISYEKLEAPPMHVECRCSVSAWFEE